MRRLFGLLICALLAFAALSSGRAANPATPSPMATPFDCPITRPSGKQPPEVANLGGMDGFGNDALWVSLVMWSEQPGIVEVPNDDHLLPDGTVQDLKWAWYRYASGKLTIEGHRLDAPAPPLTAWIPEGYGDTGFQVSGITFPTDGCWELTGHLDGTASLTFILLVKYPLEFVPKPAAVPTRTPSDCPVTQPNGNDPPPDYIGGTGGYGNDALWSSLTMWSERPGIVEVPNDAHLTPDGRVVGMKWMWYRYLRGTLTIDGRRLDAPALPLEARIPDGYGDIGLQVSGITFPTDGCWEITGTVGNKGSLSFIVQVIYPNDFTPIGTPEPKWTPTP
ncbi:MAG TPA: hypothetical protein VEQ36_09240 [Thermomicrobiales bacterium]|nr:hypothetical protein [Thermomicrobiales bacterium]